MFPTFISILDIQSWWEVPSIAHFCSLFRTAFNLLDFDIEDLEEALLTDGTEETSWLQDLIVRLLSGCLANNEISTSNYQMFLRRLFRQKCQEHDQYNPFNTDIDFQLLPLRTKVDILHALCDFRLDADDVLEALKNLEAGSLRVEPLGYDANKSAYWYFYGTRLYREDFKKNKNSKKDNSVWQVVCFTEDDWIQLTKKLQNSDSKAEKLLCNTLEENFLPELPRLFREKERQARKRLLENLPRRTSSRIRKQEDLVQTEEKEEKIEPEKEKLEEEAKRKINAKRRREAYERRNKLKEQSEDTQTENSEDEKSRDEMAGANARGKKGKGGRSRQQSESSTSSRDHGSVFSSNSRTSTRTNQNSETSISTSSSKPVSTVGRQTNNSLACATGQIVIQPVSNPHRKKLKTSQVFRQSDEDLQTGMHKILDFVKNHDDAWPFVDPVDEEYAPNYYSVIRKPMDLQRMEERLDSGHYKSFSKFRDDFQLIVNNCHLYNGANNEYTEMVDNLLQVFERATERYLDEVTSDEEIAVEYPDLNKDSKGHKRKKVSVTPTKVKSVSTKTPKKRSRSSSSNSSEDIEKETNLDKTSRKKDKIQDIENTKRQNKKDKKEKAKRKFIDEDEKSENIKEKTTLKNSNKSDKKQKEVEKKDSKQKDKHIKAEKQFEKHSDKQNKSDKLKSKDLKPVKQVDKKSKIEETKSKVPPKVEDKKKNLKYKKKIVLKSVSPSPERFKSRSISPSPDRWSSSPPPSWPPSSPENDYFSSKRKDTGKQSSDNESSNKLKAKHDKWKEVYKDKEDIPKFTERSQSPPKHIDKHNKLRETIEKLKAKSELAKIKEKEKRELEQKDLSSDAQENKTLKSKLSENKLKKKHDEIDDGASTAESVQSEKKIDNKNNAKNAAAIEALTLATEQTLKDINKWLDDTPKFEFSSASNSPSHFSSLDDFDMKVDDVKKKADKVVSKKDSCKDIKKKPFRDPSKLFRRREVQRTIDRLQPGKSKGNLISNIQSANKPDEIFPLGPLSKTLKDTKNSLIVKTDDSAPKLSLGSVLDSFGKHQFVDDAKKDDATELKTEVVLDSSETKENEVKPVTEKVDKEKVGNSPGKATPNLSAWFKAFGAPKVQPAQKKTDKTDGKDIDKSSEDKENKKEEKKVPLGDPSPTPDSPLMSYGQPRQRRISTGSSMSERSSFSQDMDSPRVGIDERLGVYPAPYPSPLHKSPSGASPIMASPRPDVSPKAYPAFNGQMRVGFYQDTVSTKSSPDKSCSPRDNPQSPYPQYSEHIYTPPTQNSSYSYGNPSYYSQTPNYSSSNPTPPHNIEPNPSYFDTSKPLTDQYQKVLPNYSSPVNSQLPSPVSQQHSPALSQQNSPGPVSPHISPNPDKIPEKQIVSCPVKKRAFEMQNEYNPRTDINVLTDRQDTSNSPAHSVSPVNEMAKYQNTSETIPTDNIPSIDITESSDSNSSQRNSYNPTSPYNYNAEMNYSLNIPSTRNLESERSIDMSKFTNMGYAEPDVNFQRTTYNARNDVNYQRPTTSSPMQNIPQSNPSSNPNVTSNIPLRYNEADLINMGYKQLNTQNTSSQIQNMNRSNILQPVRSTSDSSRLAQPLDVTSGYKSSEMTIPRPNYNSTSMDIDQALGLRNLSNLSQIVDRYPGDERMLGLQPSGQSFYSDKNITGAHMLSKPISTTASSLPMFSQPNITIPYSTMQGSNPIYSRQMTSMPSSNMMGQDKQVAPVAVAAQEKKGKKRKTPKTATPPTGMSDAVSNVATSTQNQGFQSYAGLKNSSLEPSAISLKTTSVVPGSAFNFGPSPTSLGLGSALYSEKDGFSTYLDEYRTAPNYYMTHAAAATHHRTTPDTAEKPVRTPHQATPGQAPTYPFIGAPQPRPPSYPLGGAFMSPHQAPLMDPSSQLYQQYFQSGMLHQGLLGAPSAYPAGYHPTLSMRQPYDAMNRPSWL